MKKFEFRTIEKESQLVILKFDGYDLSVWRVCIVDGAWNAPLCEVAEAYARHIQMEIVHCIGLPVVAKADWYKDQLFILSNTNGQDIDLERLTEVYKKTFGE